MAHAVHERTTDDIHCAAILRDGLIKVLGKIVAHTLHKSCFQALFERGLSPCLGSCRVDASSLFFELGCERYEALCGIGVTIEHNIFHDCTKFQWDILVLHRCLRIHDTHVHSRCYGMIEEHRMQRLTHIVVATEREGEIAHSATDMRTWKILLYPCTRTDEIEPVCSVLLDTCSYREYIGVEDYVIRCKACLFGQQPVGTPAHLNLALKSCRLPVLIECHHHHSSTESLCLARTTDEVFLALLQGYGVDD